MNVNPLLPLNSLINDADLIIMFLRLNMKITPQALQTNRKTEKALCLISTKELNVLFLLFPTQMTELLHISKQ